MSAESSGSNDSDRDIDPSLNSVKVANFILLYGLRTVVQLFHSLLVSSVSVFFFRCWLHTTSICASCLCRSLPVFCQYCWNVDGLGSLLSCSVCVVSSVEGLMFKYSNILSCLYVISRLNIFPSSRRS